MATPKTTSPAASETVMRVESAAPAPRLPALFLVVLALALADALDDLRVAEADALLLPVVTAGVAVPLTPVVVAAAERDRIEPWCHLEHIDSSRLGYVENVGHEPLKAETVGDDKVGLVDHRHLPCRQLEVVGVGTDRE